MAKFGPSRVAHSSGLQESARDGGVAARGTAVLVADAIVRDRECLRFARKRGVGSCDDFVVEDERALAAGPEQRREIGVRGMLEVVAKRGAIVELDHGRVAEARLHPALVGETQLGAPPETRLNMLRLAALYRTLVDALYIDTLRMIREEVRRREVELLPDEDHA